MVPQRDGGWLITDMSSKVTGACCGPWGHKESDTTELLNNKNKSKIIIFQKSNLRKLIIGKKSRGLCFLPRNISVMGSN